MIKPSAQKPLKIGTRGSPLALAQAFETRTRLMEAHGLTEAHPRPSFGVHAPIVSPGGIVFFGRGPV